MLDAHVCGRGLATPRRPATCAAVCVCHNGLDLVFGRVRSRASCMREAACAFVIMLAPSQLLPLDCCEHAGNPSSADRRRLRCFLWKCWFGLAAAVAWGEGESRACGSLRARRAQSASTFASFLVWECQQGDLGGNKMKFIGTVSEIW